MNANANRRHRQEKDWLSVTYLHVLACMRSIAR